MLTLDDTKKTVLEVIQEFSRVEIGNKLSIFSMEGFASVLIKKLTDLDSKKETKSPFKGGPSHGPKPR